VATGGGTLDVIEQMGRSSSIALGNELDDGGQVVACVGKPMNGKH